MSKLRFNISVSLDGYMAGPSQSEEEPLGVGGEDLHDWMFGLEAWRRAHGKEGGEVNASTPVVEDLEKGFGAVIMGRNMFGPPAGGDWDEANPWNGWWGDEPPYHNPVFILTHHDREPVEMEGGTTYNFVTDGITSALDQARDTAGERDILIAGGAQTINQYLAAGLVDEMRLNVSPRLLGGGARLFEGVEGLQLEQAEAIDAPGVAHLRYRVVK